MNRVPESLLQSHEQFLQQYVLNRALGHTGGLDPCAALESAEKAYQKIQEIITEAQVKAGKEIKE